MFIITAFTFFDALCQLAFLSSIVGDPQKVAQFWPQLTYLYLSPLASQRISFVETFNNPELSKQLFASPSVYENFEILRLCILSNEEAKEMYKQLFPSLKKVFAGDLSDTNGIELIKKYYSSNYYLSQMQLKNSVIGAFFLDLLKNSASSSPDDAFDLLDFEKPRPNLGAKGLGIAGLGLGALGGPGGPGGPGGGPAGPGGPGIGALGGPGFSGLGLGALGDPSFGNSNAAARIAAAQASQAQAAAYSGQVQAAKAQAQAAQAAAAQAVQAAQAAQAAQAKSVPSPQEILQQQKSAEITSENRLNRQVVEDVKTILLTVPKKLREEFIRVASLRSKEYKRIYSARLKGEVYLEKNNYEKLDKSLKEITAKIMDYYLQFKQTINQGPTSAMLDEAIYGYPVDDVKSEPSRPSALQEPVKPATAEKPERRAAEGRAVRPAVQKPLRPAAERPERPVNERPMNEFNIKQNNQQRPERPERPERPLGPNNSEPEESELKEGLKKLFQIVHEINDNLAEAKKSIIAKDKDAFKKYFLEALKLSKLN